MVTDRPHAGFWQTMDYSIWERKDGGLPQLVPVTAMQPKAVITAPAPGEIVKAGVEYTIRGAAWAGENAVEKVEVSTDGGKTWQPAELGHKAPLAWTFWRYKWATPKGQGAVKFSPAAPTTRVTRSPRSATRIAAHT